MMTEQQAAIHNEWAWQRKIKAAKAAGEPRPIRDNGPTHSLWLRG